jgi:hypothetical protein
MRDAPERLAGLRRWANLLDESIAIPGTSLRVGIDPLLDILPGIGDALGVLASSYILVVAFQLGLPRASLVRMAFNLAVDAVLGIFPVVGVFFDAGWKANTRNVDLIERNLGAARPGRSDAAFMVGLVLGLVALFALAGWASVSVLMWILEAMVTTR